MPHKYAIRITEANLALITMLHPLVEVRVTEDINRFFLFTVYPPMSSGDHDVVHGDDLKIYDGEDDTERVILY